MAIILLIIAFIVNALASILLKLNAVRGAGFNNIRSFEIITGNIYLIFSLFLFVTNIVFYYLALRSIPLSVAYPIMVVGAFLIVGLSSIFVFRESLNNVQFVGYFLAVLGIILVSFFSK